MKKKLLLHSCCAPCACAVIHKLQDDFDITFFFPDSNIYPEREYQKRRAELQKISRQQKIPLITTNYIYPEWKAMVAAGLENSPEGGPRCVRCYIWRLDQAAQEAQKQGIEHLASTLSISPHKNSQVINEILKNICNKYKLQGVFQDFGPLFSCSCELSKKHDFYRQKYCGCEFSLPGDKK